MSGKHVELLKELVPTQSRIEIIGDPDVNTSQFQSTKTAGRRLMVNADVGTVRRTNDIDGAFRTASEKKVGAVVMLSSPLTLAYPVEIADLARRYRLPRIFVYRFHVDAGGLLPYGSNPPEMFHRCGVYVAKILTGGKPAEMPVERPVAFELVINLKTAKPLA